LDVLFDAVKIFLQIPLECAELRVVFHDRKVRLGSGDIGLALEDLVELDHPVLLSCVSFGQ